MIEIAGFRVLRRVASGARARLDLGFSAGSTVVLKSTPLRDGAAVVEAEALERAAGPHVVALDDVASDASRRVLVLEWLQRGPLADLLERRGVVSAGEAVTLIVPIARALSAAHRAGVAHGRVGVDAVALRADGAPVLVGFGSATLFDAGLPEVVLERTPAVVADRRALVELAAVILGRVDGPERPAAEAAVRALGGRSAGATADAAMPSTPGDVERVVGALAPARPVGEAGDDGDEGVPWHVLRRDLAAIVGDPGGAAARAQPASLPAPPTSLPAPISAALAPLPVEWRDRVAALLATGWRTWTALSRGRRQLALGGIAAAVVLGIAMAPVAGPSEGAPAAEEWGEGWTPLDEQAAVDLDPSADSGRLDAGAGEDPVAATVLLLAERDRCLRDLDAECLATVTQDGSAAREADLGALEQVRSGDASAWREIPVEALRLAQSLGDSVLLEAGDGARLLVIRTAHGWRIRAYLDAVPAPERE